MKLTGADLPRLQWSLLAALLMIGGGAAASYVALDTARGARSELTTAQKARDEIDGKSRRVRHEEAEIRQSSALYSALQTRGVIGEERRLEWVELLKAISERRRLLDLRYEFAPQRALDTDPSAPPATSVPASSPASAHTFYASRMTLELGLLHEEDLTRLLDDLRQQASALVRVKRCDIARVPRSQDGEHKANLRAVCQLDWITLRAPAGEGSRP